MAALATAPEQLYSGNFHADRDARTRATARAVLGHVQRWVAPASLCDAGCGVGTWLAAAGELGIADIQGFEGPWARSAPLVVPRGAIAFGDLQQPIACERRFDLAISLEVAEHLSEDRAPGFVADLTRLSDCVLFSAAIPMQGGVGHINERWQSWWAALFAQQGYEVFDIIRPLIWNDPAIAFWYRQNMLVYARSGSEPALLLEEVAQTAPAMLDLVHPEQYLFAEEAQPRRAIGRAVKRVLGRG